MLWRKSTRGVRRVGRSSSSEKRRDAAFDVACRRSALIAAGRSTNENTHQCLFDTVTRRPPYFSSPGAPINLGSESSPPHPACCFAAAGPSLGASPSLRATMNRVRASANTVPSGPSVTFVANQIFLPSTDCGAPERVVRERQQGRCARREFRPCLECAEQSGGLHTSRGSQSQAHLNSHGQKHAGQGRDRCFVIDVQVCLQHTCGTKLEACQRVVKRACRSETVLASRKTPAE